jgi:hypothetical protein
MKPHRQTGHDYITLDGPDRNALGAAEALAREDFARPEKFEIRRQYWKTLFQASSPISLAPIHTLPANPPKVA